MPLDPVRNFAKVIVSTGYATGELSIDLQRGDASKLPDPSVDGAFNLVWWNASDYSDPSDDPNVEIVRVTSTDGDSLTIERGQEGTADVDHNTAGKTYKMVLALTEKMISDIGNRNGASAAGLLATVDDIDLTSGGPVELYTAPNLKAAIVTSIVIRSVSGIIAPLSVPSIGIGTSGMDNMFAIAPLTDFDSASKVFILQPSGTLALANQNETIEMIIDTPAEVDEGGEYAVSLDIFGYLIDFLD